MKTIYVLAVIFLTVLLSILLRIIGLIPTNLDMQPLAGCILGVFCVPVFIFMEHHSPFKQNK